MPQRTNPFQELVHLIELAFSSPSDRVTASPMETGHGLETEREIDIRRETTNGLYTIKIAIEAKDEGRAWDVTKVETYIGKYQGRGSVAADKVVLVSRHGFTSGARERAEAVGFSLVTLDEAKDFDWAKFEPKYGPLKKETTLHVRMDPHVCRVVFDPPIPGDGDGQAAKEGKLVCAHSKDHGTPFEFAQRAIFQNKHPPTLEKLQELRSLAVGQPNGAELHAGFDMSHYRLDYRGAEHPLSHMTAVVHTVDAATQAQCKAYEMETGEGKRILHSMSATLGEKHFHVVMPQGLKSMKLAMQIGDPPKTPKQRAEERKKKRKNKQ